MAARPEAPTGARPRGRVPARSAKLSRDIIVNAALTFLDREGWDALTINALAAHPAQLLSSLPDRTCAARSGCG